ncbi:MerC domain-containing protein [Sphingomonas sp. PL-96]|uniref:MerC domain-containing protein n=1 Tax=Sphingomonas sp. PL-96 TaxID=2887201 RepID=UPI001E5F4701|nr:MerC domain-containing protein [Sphingomonas sp. PL-96]MCC2977093.1 MerC domain-containing protein [Sphingomonas sp. PL-96]
MDRTKRKNMHDWLDTAAIAGSVLCAIHCLLLPLVLAATPILSRWLDFGEGFHLGVLLFAVPTSAVALIGGWRRHAAASPLALGTLGLLLMMSALRMPDPADETLLTVLGSGLLASAHLLNWGSRRRYA